MKSHHGLVIVGLVASAILIVAAVGFLLELSLGPRDAWSIVEAVGGLIVLLVAGSELRARYRKLAARHPKPS